MTFDLLVIGDANPDVIAGPLTADLAFGQREQLAERGVLTLGGSAAITAAGAARLGLRVAIAARVGNDAAGRFVRDVLEERGVDTRALHTDPDLPTPLTIVLTRGSDRAIVTTPGTFEATTPADVPADLLASCRHVHASSYFLLPKLAAGLPELFRTARAHGASSSLDTNDDPAGRWDGVSAVLPEVGYLLPNAAEACRLAGVADAREAAAALASRGPVVVVKDGAEGAFAVAGDAVVSARATPVEAVDAVGAGDSFNAGFLAATLGGLPVEQALRFAVACGGRSVLAAGGTASQPTWDEALAHTEYVRTETA
ncbi:sugar/nucleoside kinase (ribokinase family) [Amycolatopsis bartoniae]|uniref:Carbohydrate kinase PfkB domain-containing protein n=1 Tax=Amycolatopsis bartoniae TaxID=941986 RepID=A0A8H9M8E0_9PSEU|nr:carbohydrate kinase family protein [Amycolatopsis bartoniae]MBB2937776.1 sugar/nucleoside kinase (ribokinase family) [Amycolatopsis bartoniae]TVT06554.1 carbohydrate kinase family protein [Amycolatopsis bartoniae]GHF40630.1 hypothetical protein GCM10017566_12540 [Amycolatopsis bartoniae]